MRRIITEMKEFIIGLIVLAGLQLIHYLTGSWELAVGLGLLIAGLEVYRRWFR